MKTLPLVLLSLAAPALLCVADDDPSVAAAPPTLTAGDVQSIIQTAAQSVSSAISIAVTDRQGNILGVFRKPGTPLTSAANFSVQADTNEVAVALARTASFFSHSQAPLSSRTVRYLSGIHFPPGIPFAGNAALYGIENTNRGCSFNVQYLPGQAFPQAQSIDASTTGLGMITGKKDVFDSDPNAVNPGGIPLYKGGRMVGGIGVAGASPNIAEFAALTGSVGAGFGPTPADPGVVVIDGVDLPFANQTTRPSGVGTGDFVGDFLVGPMDSPGPDPDGDLIAPAAGPLGGLAPSDVSGILDAGVAVANRTRAIIRLPLGSRTRMVIAVADLDGTIIGLRRMPDATVFSIDVAVAKSRNVIYFSGPGRSSSDLPGVPALTAVTNRTIGFGGQPLYPPGINFSSPGPFFGLFKQDVANPCTQGAQAPNPNQNGIVFFPGALPLYRNGALIGGIGVSGDGVDQDDYVTSNAAAGFEAPDNIHADNVFVNGVRLPYLKFPRNPED